MFCKSVFDLVSNFNLIPLKKLISITIMRELEIKHNLCSNEIFFIEDSASLDDLELRVLASLWTDGDDFFSNGLAAVCGLRFADPGNDLADKLFDAARVQDSLSTGDPLDNIDEPLAALLRGESFDSESLGTFDQKRLQGLQAFTKGKMIFMRESNLSFFELFVFEVLEDYVKIGIIMTKNLNRFFPDTTRRALLPHARSCKTYDDTQLVVFSRTKTRLGTTSLRFV